MNYLKVSLGFPCGLPRGRGLSSVPRGPGCRQGTAVPLHPGCVGSLCPGAGVVSGARGCRDVRWWLRSSPAGMRGPWEVRDSEGCWAQPTRAGRRGGGARGGECFCPRYAAGDFGVEQRHALGSGRARSLLGPSPAPHRGAARRLCGGDGRPARHRRRPAGPGHTAPRRLPPPPPRRGCAVRAAAAPPPGLGIPVTAEPIRAPCWRCRPVSARRRPGRERCGGGRAALPRSPAVASPRPMGIESFCSADGHDPFWVSGGMGP